MEKDYFDSFKPIRNRLRKVNFIEVLERLYFFMNSKQHYFVPEIYEFVYVNALIYCSIEQGNINHYKEINKILIETRELNNRIHSICMRETDDPFGFIRKTYLNQEKSKVNQYFNQMFRYYSIFSEPTLSRHIENKIGMSYYNFVLCSFWLFSKFINNYHINESYFFAVNISDTKFNKDNMSKVLNILSMPYVEMQNVLKSEMIYDRNAFLFHGKQHIKTPIIRYNGHLICLYNDVLLKQSTAGIYYTAEIFDNQYNLNNPFGKGFERYIGIILNKLNRNDKYIITPEGIYSKGNKTSDWIIVEKTSIIFLECKTKRQILDSKLYTSSRDDDEKLQQYAAEEISKIYKVYNDYKNNSIDSMPYDNTKQFIPIIIFLEDGLYLNIGNKIAEKIKTILISKNIPPEFVDEFPFHIFSTFDFEYRIQLMFELGFSDYFKKIQSGDISQEYIENYKYIDYFSDDFINEFIRPNETVIC